jgi:LysR family transcriptional regulator for metE and metH
VTVILAQCFVMIELRHLRLITALSEGGTLTRAAQRLHLSQPALSHQLRELEEELGGELFQRKTSPLRFTAGGKLMLQTAKRVLGELDRMSRHIRQANDGHRGALRIAVECHSCFEWLMPSMDAFRAKWPEVEMDLVSGFHADPLGLLETDEADLVIVSQQKKHPQRIYMPLFRYEVLALMAHEHPLAAKPCLTARDFEKETLIHYPIPDERLDLVREVLKPASIDPLRKPTLLTVAILQLVASRRGIAALPGWAVQAFLDRDYVAAKPVGRHGLFSALHAAIPRSMSDVAYMKAFVETMRTVSRKTLKGITLTEG